MMWLEMSKDETHGGDGWGFTQCLWAPTKRRDGTTWPYWTSLGNVRQGDLVLHLRGKRHQAFVGFSEAADDGYQTIERPPIPGQWSFADAYYRVPVRNFTEFASKLFLKDVFSMRDNELRSYFRMNRSRTTAKEHLFYVIQSGRLQCFNGAYLSQVEPELLDLLLTENVHIENKNEVGQLEVVTSQQVREIKTRVGQQAFASSVKQNYGYRCAFPGCDVSDPALLVGAHIARWSDVVELRHDISNGICFCLIHDKAFELGYFTVDEGLKIAISHQQPQQEPWVQQHLVPYDGQPLRVAPVCPSVQALKHHWKRISYISEKEI